MNGGIATLISFILIALLLSVLGIALGNPVLSSIGMLNVLLGALIGFPLVFVGNANVKRATRLLSGTQLKSVNELLAQFIVQAIC